MIIKIDLSSHFYLNFLPTDVFNFKMIEIFCHKKDFRQLFDTILVFCDIEFWSIYGPILCSFLLTTNLATTEWTR